MDENRGRPKTIGLEEAKPTKFERIYDNKDGTGQIWKYNLEVSPNGPISVEETGKRINTTGKIEETQEKLNESLPATRQKYWSEQTGKWVGYGRAKQLGIIK